MEGEAVVEVGESDAVFCADRLTDNDLVYVIELIPVFITEVGGGRREGGREGGGRKGRGLRGGGKRNSVKFTSFTTGEESHVYDTSVYVWYLCSIIKLHSVSLTSCYSHH